MRRSITFRLVAMFALAALATFALIGAALYGVLQRELTRHEDDELRTYLQNLQYSIDRYGTADRWERLRTRLDTLTPADGSVRFWVLCDDPRFQYGKDLAAIEQMNLDADGRGAIVMPQRQHALRVAARRLEALEDRPAVRLIIGVDTAPYAQTLRTFLSALTLLALGAVALVVLLGYWIARVGLKPLERLSKDAQALRPKTRSQRLQTTALPDELSDLAGAFNGALGRLEEAYAQLESFNADVAHELRTPLANLIGGTQVALSHPRERPRAAAELEEVLQSNLEELERLRSIVNDMLFLARADRGEAATSLVRTRVADEVKKTIDFFEFVLDESRMTVEIAGDTEAQAALETALFRRAMSNLLQNAIEHSAAGARLVVHIVPEHTHAGDAIRVSVSNPGLAIEAPHLQRLFDRFYRVDAARHDLGEHHGHGLGLAIVKAVAHMHGGQVMAESRGGVNTIGFSVPAAAGS